MKESQFKKNQDLSSLTDDSSNNISNRQASLSRIRPEIAEQQAVGMDAQQAEESQIQIQEEIKDPLATHNTLGLHLPATETASQYTVNASELVASETPLPMTSPTHRGKQSEREWIEAQIQKDREAKVPESTNRLVVYGGMTEAEIEVLSETSAQ